VDVAAFVHPMLAVGLCLTLLGAWIAARTRMGAGRWWVVGPALMSLPLASGLGFSWLAREIPVPYSTFYPWGKLLGDVDLPTTKFGVFDTDFPDRVLVYYDAAGQILFRGRRTTYAEFERLLTQRPDLDLLLLADKNAPFQHLAWLLDAARAAGRRRVYLGAERRTWRVGGWPMVEVEIPLRADEGGRTLRLLAGMEAPRPWGPDMARTTVLMPTAVAYVSGDRRAQDASVVWEWSCEGPFDVVEVAPRVPLRFLIAAFDEITRTGHALPAIGSHFPFRDEPRPPPSDAARARQLLPYPSD